MAKAKAATKKSAKDMIKNSKAVTSKKDKAKGLVVAPTEINGEQRFVVLDTINLDENKQPTLRSDANGKGFRSKEAAMNFITGKSTKKAKVDYDKLTIQPEVIDGNDRFVIVSEDGEFRLDAGGSGYKTIEGAERQIDSLRNPEKYQGMKKKYTLDEKHVIEHPEVEGRFAIAAKEDNRILNDNQGKGFKTRESATAQLTGEKQAKAPKVNPYSIKDEDMVFIDAELSQDLTK